MRNQYYLLALLLSVAGHVGLIFVLDSGKLATASYGSPQSAATTVEVQLGASGSIELPVRPILPGLNALASPESDSKSQPVDAEPPHAAASAAGARIPSGPEITGDQLASLQSPMPQPSEGVASLPLANPALPHYFRADELTENPILLQDIDPDTFMALPDNIPPHVARAYILINEQGEVDQVVIDEEDLSEEAKRFVSDAFAKVKFSPGKLNGLAVKSQLSIEISLERAKVAPIPVIMR